MAAAEFSSDVFEGLNGERRGREGRRGTADGRTEAVAPIRHLVGGKDNRRVESSHLDGRRRRGERVKDFCSDSGRTQVGLSKNGKEQEGRGGRLVNSRHGSSALNNPSFPLFCCLECSRPSPFA